MTAIGACLVALFACAAPVPKGGPPRVLVASSNKDGNWEIYLVQPGTGEVKRLTDHKANDLEPVWAPDGKRIAFISDRQDGTNVWTMAADGADLQQLTKKQGTCYAPRWSPDGSRIAFTGSKTGRDQVYTVDVATGKVAQLTTDAIAGRQPAWSPDGKKLSYSSYTGRYPTYVMNADGSEKVRLTDENGGLDAMWVPVGNQLVYTAVTGTGKDSGFRVYTVGADGKNTKQRTTKPNAFGNVYPQWSPDGGKISYGELVDGLVQVAVMNADGSEPKVITSKHQHFYTRWSPDGKSISVTRFAGGQTPTLIVMDANGENAKELLRNVGTAAPEWKPK
jgi:Tol biopolymer transport system component